MSETAELKSKEQFDRLIFPFLNPGQCFNDEIFKFYEAVEYKDKSLCSKLLLVSFSVLILTFIPPALFPVMYAIASIPQPTDWFLPYQVKLVTSLLMRIIVSRFIDDF